jgi:hypothetical protein
LKLFDEVMKDNDGTIVLSSHYSELVIAFGGVIRRFWYFDVLKLIEVT